MRNTDTFRSSSRGLPCEGDSALALTVETNRATEDCLRTVQSDLRDARRYLRGAGQTKIEAFASRQLRSRRRLSLMLKFYQTHHCRLARLHLLAACAVTIGRFAGYSPSFDDLGDAFMPVDLAGQPRTAEWEAYARACDEGRPLELREELWLEAHMIDLELVRISALDKAFNAEAAENKSEPTWGLLRQHMEVTLGARLMDHDALSGAVAYETVFAQSLGVTVYRLFTASWLLLGCYAWETLRALFSVGREGPRQLVGYRRTALELMRYSVTAWSTSRVFRRGLRARERGRRAGEEGWPLLEQALGERVSEVHPMIVSFYTNPERFRVTARLELHTIPARLWSWLATLLIGQGMYETDREEIDARFRVFRRADGSMHFIRELYCGDVLRVFDSDFVVREIHGRRALFEVFVDNGIAVEMDVQPTSEGGLVIKSRDIYMRGVRLPSTGVQIEFRSQVATDSERRQWLHIDGHLLMRPRTRFGRFVVRRLLRRPEQLGCIHYVAHLINSSASNDADSTDDHESTVEAADFRIDSDS